LGRHGGSEFSRRGQPWGLFRHYWVLLKLSATTVLTLLLMLHMQPTRRLGAAAGTIGFDVTVRPIQVQLAVDAAGALIALVVIVALAIAKPRGVTRLGLIGRGDGDETTAAGAGMPRWAVVLIVAAVVILIAIKMLSGAGPHH
jgi:hypothetical protein